MAHLGLQTHAFQSIPPIQSFPSGKLGSRPVSTGIKFKFPGPVSGVAPFALPGGAGILRFGGRVLSKGRLLLTTKGTILSRLRDFGLGVLGFQILKEVGQSTVEDRPLDITNIVTPKAIATTVGLASGGLITGGLGTAVGFGLGGVTRGKQVIDFAGEQFSKLLPPPDSSFSPKSLLGLETADAVFSDGPQARPPSGFDFPRSPDIETNVNLGFPASPAFNLTSPGISVQAGGGGIPLGMLLLLLGGAGLAGFGLGKKKKKKKEKKHKHKTKKSKKRHKLLIRKGLHK